MKHDGLAESIIIGALMEEQAELFLECTTAKELWTKILTLHEKRSEVSVLNLYEEYFALKMEEGESVSAYVSKVSKIAAEIESQGEKLSDNIKMVRIVSSLTPRFKNFRTVWYNIKEGRDLTNLLVRLKLEEDQLNSVEKSEAAEGAFNARYNQRGFRRGARHVEQ